MKTPLLCFLLFASSITFAQNSKITQLLNSQLQKEYNKFFDEHDQSIFKIIEPFRIDNKGVLTVSISWDGNASGGKTKYLRKVPIDKIIKLDKDHNVIFVTEADDVVEIKTEYDNKGNIVRESTQKSHLFFTEINREKHNIKFRNQVIKAFKKAGHTITSEYWWD